MAIRNRQLAALAFFAAMTVLHSWPLASDPMHLRLDSHDTELNTWVVAWASHTLPRAPLSLFEAPIFYPEHHSLAFSEHMIVQDVIGAPLAWLGATPVLVYNILIMLGLALSGWSMYLLMASWTGSVSAGLIAGLVYAFNAHVLTRFMHLQAQHVEFFPLMLYALDRVLVGRTLRDAVLLAIAFVLQSLCSNYLLVFMTYSLVVAIAIRWKEFKPALPQLAVAGVISVILLAPFLWPYYQVDQAQGLTRGVDVVARYDAGWRDYLDTGGRLHFAWWSHLFSEGRTALFPGITALLLCGIAVFSTRALRNPRIRMTLAIGILGVALSFGDSLPGYTVLHQFLPLLSELRSVARWGWLALAAIAILAGFGTAAITRSNKRWIPIAIGLLVTIESIRMPMAYTRFDGIPHFYERLASIPNLVLAEFPFYSGASVGSNGPYVLANTKYFQPLLNGYSSFHPESFGRRGRVLGTFPSEPALAELQVTKVTHVSVHTQAFARRYGQAALKAIDTIPELEFVVEEDGIRLYRLK